MDSKKGKLDIFEISFSNTNGVFYVGTMLQGQVTIELNEPMDMRGIRLTFVGKADVRWRRENDSSFQYFSASETYFNEDVLLFGVLSSPDDVVNVLKQGRHVFPFNFQLPQELPSSFESAYGHVRYIVKCSIEKSWKFNHIAKQPFTIIRVLDLNQEPNVSQSVQGVNNKMLCCLCCKSGPINASFHINKRGFVPGEAIIHSAEISNDSNRKIKKSCVVLKMVATYHATSKSRMDVTSFACIVKPGIEAHGNDVWSGEELVIPSLPPSFLNGCKIIDIHYILQLNVDPSGPAYDLEVPLEIIIGTNPLVSVMQQNWLLPSLDPSNLNNWESISAPLSATMDNSVPSSGILALSYAESAIGKFSIRELDFYTRGTLDFAPLYTYYNWENTSVENTSAENTSAVPK